MNASTIHCPAVPSGCINPLSGSWLVTCCVIPVLERSATCQAGDARAFLASATARLAVMRDGPGECVVPGNLK